jgi:hypothetical protein
MKFENEYSESNASIFRGKCQLFDSMVVTQIEWAKDDAGRNRLCCKRGSQAPGAAEA